MVIPRAAAGEVLPVLLHPEVLPVLQSHFLSYSPSGGAGYLSLYRLISFLSSLFEMPLLYSPALSVARVDTWPPDVHCPHHALVFEPHSWICLVASR